LHRWFNHFAFVLFDPDIAATTPLYGWQFLTSDFNLEYLISRYLKFDPANCGSRVFVGPGRTQSVCPHGMMIWIQIPSLVLKAAMQALLSALNPTANKNFVIQVMCWDGEYQWYSRTWCPSGGPVYQQRWWIYGCSPLKSPTFP
jgi:hypothetical protein